MKIEMKSFYTSASIAILLGGFASSCAEGPQTPSGAGGSSGSVGEVGGLGGGTAADPPTIRVSDAHPVLEDTVAIVTVELSHPWKSDIAVVLETQDGTAKGDPDGGKDYVPVNKLVTFPAGSVSASVSIPVKTP